MPTHWTYEAFETQDHLQQGDILEPTQELRDILSSVHPHFLDPKYTAFLIVTQSCDIVCRKGGLPDTRYINIAVVRPLETVLHNFLSQVCECIVDGVYLKESKADAHRLMERIFNQNEQALGIFYLHPDVNAGIDTPSVSLLRVKVTLRVEHYEVLRKARRGRLSSDFRSKLGWLVGNLYARIGTPDWTDSEDKKKQLENLIRDWIDAEEDLAPKWVPRLWVESAKKKGVELEGIPKNQIYRVLSEHRPLKAKEQAVEHVLRLIREADIGISEDNLLRIGNRLNNDELFTKAIKSAKYE
ncbi:MAG: hypothetical protein FD151_2221 [bacterium]|nr:MAG: hypothetical protein FD151_2221 [bacterium]